MNLFIFVLLGFIAISFSMAQDGDSNILENGPSTPSGFINVPIGELSTSLPEFCTGKYSKSKKVKACCAEILSESKIVVPG
ncbi:hypothetical protein Mgra_00004571 [Meloidogyne graminicola]|uniref:Uncharacterized protein n=1 Tax=Meloidogyne graminicola TaxID=189291 RepID=A0A8S9ZRD9_9BILA|nr:hypothetical protein Mgra_00004571 [Meloidogyne graminicola]